MSALRGKIGTREWVADFMESVLFPRLRELRAAGQKEYAHSESAFDNFERLGKQLDLLPMKILWVYLSKHLDGIQSYLKGHVSQREDVAGRIEDAIVYLILLRAWREIERGGGAQTALRGGAGREFTTMTTTPSDQCWEPLT